MTKKSKTEEQLELLELDPLALEDEFVTLPADMARLNEKYADALRDQLRAKFELEQVEARLYIQISEIAQKAKEKDPKAKGRSRSGLTEAAIKSRILGSEEYQDARLELIDAEVDRVKALGRLEALRVKKDACISIGAQIRAEKEMNPRLRRDSAAMRDIERSRSQADDDSEENDD